ncbi:hypothetical protein C8Q77DRAFT_1078386 [Trametes polyzona]|nr:hypothetical protein C8Q77DRAFT_1078386 [Trametes polyzona]
MSPALPPSPSFASLTTAHHAQHSAPDEDTPVSPKVRFDEDCVLIPDPVPTSRLPRLVTKSYSLPLWKRKPARDPSVVSDTEEDANDDHVVFKVSVPSLTTKARSPSRGDAPHRPLVPCLVHSPHPSASTDSASSSSDSPQPRQSRPRRASLPQPVQPDAVVVPLRACCSQCYASIDRCMKEGDHWKVHFSKGAARRRKSVSDAHAPTPSRSARHCVRDVMPGFDAIIAVDEVDRRRRSTDADALTAFTLEVPCASHAAQAATADPDEIPLRRALSLPDESHPCRVAGVHHIHALAHAPAIPEEDELRPSPRRTPIPSPFASVTNLSSPHIVHTVQAKLAQRVTSPPSDPIPTPLPGPMLPEKAAIQTPLPASPSPIPHGKEPPSYFSMPYQPAHDDRPFVESPTSSPSSSPRIEHTRPAGLGGPRKRSLIHIPAPGTIFRASTQMLKGISNMGGVPMSV